MHAVWKEIEKALFDAALNLPDAEVRQAFLVQSCGENAALRERLEQLLAASAVAADFFNLPPPPLDELVAATGSALSASRVSPPSGMADDLGEGAPVWIGRYRLIERMGEGGHGVVYLAEQEEPLRRQVALKIIRLGMDTERVLARFELERQALALMNHPNIAQVLDAGVTDSGRPFFVMELVSGVRITDFCNEHRLAIRLRLELFVQVCLAVQHAHQKGILHRDIKPSNVLIALQDGVPVPKVIDFGIAKAVEGRLVHASLTEGDQFIGTPAYMSPEQAETNGRDVDTRSDIYSLGALLYELLVGRPPFDGNQLQESGVDGMRRILRECEPLAPSAMLRSLDPGELASIAMQRSVDASRLQTTIRGDLDWVVMMTLEKDRQRRYATANGLSLDIQRYLKDELVSARRHSGLNRLRKLIRRNKTVFAGTVAVATVLTFGLGTSTWLFLKERDARLRETELRVQAEKSEAVSRAVFLTRDWNYEQANAILSAIGKSPTRPSLDGLSAYREVGTWLARQGRFKEAAERFEVVMKLDRLDTQNFVTLDYQCYGVLLMEADDLAGYERFRQTAAADYARTLDGNFGSRVLKSCLLRPLDDRMMKQLQPLGDTVERWFSRLDSKDSVDWMAIPASLWWYRKGDFLKAEECARRSAEFGGNDPARVATVRLILAMSAFRNGRIDEAQLELGKGREAVEGALGAGLQGDKAAGFWYDWLFARILLREATALITGKLSPAVRVEASGHPGAQLIPRRSPLERFNESWDRQEGV